MPILERYIHLLEKNRIEELKSSINIISNENCVNFIVELIEHEYYDYAITCINSLNNERLSDMAGLVRKTLCQHNITIKYDCSYGQLYSQILGFLIEQKIDFDNNCKIEVETNSGLDIVGANNFNHIESH